MGENGCSNNFFVPISNFVSQLAIGLLLSLLTADEYFILKKERREDKRQILY